MLKTNEANLVEFYMQCNPGQPRIFPGWDVDRHGKPFILPSIGGIVTNIQVGDPAFGWQGDHIEPGVSCTADTRKPFEHPNNSLQLLACVGNKAKVISGEAKGAEGVVIGHHGGSEHLIVDFPFATKQKMSYEDTILIQAIGQGLKLEKYPDIFCYNLDPRLLKLMKIKEKNGKLQVPVTTLVPAEAMGSGIGSAHVASGDYDLCAGDPETVAKYKLDKVRFGDFVALLDHDNRYGRDFRRGAISIGVVVHSNCFLAGHGPGVTTLLTCATPLIEPVLDPKANIADLMKIGTQVKSK